MIIRTARSTTAGLLGLLTAFGITSCGGSDHPNSLLRVNGSCLASAGEPREIIFEDFSDGTGACAFSPEWEEVLGEITEGVDECSLSYRLDAGDPDELIPAKVEVNAAGLERLTGSQKQQYLRVEWQDYFSSGYHFPSSQKLARFYDSAGGKSFVNVQVSDNNAAIQLLFWVSNGGEGVSYFQNHSQAWGLEQVGGVPLDQVVTFELEAMLPTRDEPGFARLRFAGTELYLETDAQVERIAERGCFTGFSGLWVGGNWTNVGAEVASDSQRYIDNVRVSAMP